MNTGTVKFYNEQKGFGFINDDISGQDIFVHCSALKLNDLELEINEGDKVTYDIETTKKGTNAINIRLA